LGVVATKGGVGKTTIVANLGGLLLDIGYRVLLMDADVQPSLSRHYVVGQEAEHGLTKMVMDGSLTPECISHLELPPESFAGDTRLLNRQHGCLHLVRSDTRDGKLQDWLSNRLDRLMRIRIALQNTLLANNYDVAIIDTQGAIGHLQDAAVNASNLLITPASPDIISAREFVDGTLTLLDRHEQVVASMGFTVPPIRAVINRAEKTIDSRSMQNLIREQFMELRGRVTVVNTVVAAAVAYKKAATAQIPVHWIDPVKAGDTMHALLWELLPHLEGTFAPNHRGEIDPALMAPAPNVQESRGG
jgi:chromosome partitioning related protein ParA